MPPEVSVLLTAYNGETYLPATLDSILSQTLPPAEVIVVDDGSTDGTKAAVERFGDRVRYHYTPNGGICRARNIAASLARSPFLAFSDHDDLWRADKLSQQMSLHVDHPEVQYSFTNFSLVVDDVWADRTKLDDAPPNFFAPGLPAGCDPVIYKGALYRPLLHFQPIWPSTVVIGRPLFDWIGGFREELGRNPSEDLEFTLRCVQQGPIGIVREPVVGVRRHRGNFSASTERNARGQIEVFEHALAHHTLDAEDRAQLLRAIDTRRVELAYGAFRAGNFAEVRTLLQGVPADLIDRKTRLKRWISAMPTGLAQTLQRRLVRE